MALKYSNSTTGISHFTITTTDTNLPSEKRNHSGIGPSRLLISLL